MENSLIMYKFKPDEIALLKQLLSEGDLDRFFRSQLDRQDGIVSILRQHVDTLIDLISDHFMRDGLQEDSEPNQLGLRIESLIDKLNCGLRSLGKAEKKS